MSEDRVVALELALTAVIQTVREAGMDVDDLREFAAELLLADRIEAEWHLKQAIVEIESIADFLTQDHPLTG
jgi:hypothetical protein